MLEGVGCTLVAAIDSEGNNWQIMQRGQGLAKNSGEGKASAEVKLRRVIDVRVLRKGLP